MKLYQSATSPYVRKVLVAAHERGLISQIDCIDTVVSPLTRNEAVAAHNPAGKIPALITDDGQVLHDSHVIVEYLDSLSGAVRLIPRSGKKRFATLTLHSIADELCLSAVALRYETVTRPVEVQWPDWAQAMRGKILSALDDLEAHWMPHLTKKLDIGTIAVACALGYIEFRYPEISWRSDHKKLARFFDKFSERPSMQATKPSV